LGVGGCGFGGGGGWWGFFVSDPPGVGNVGKNRFGLGEESCRKERGGSKVSATGFTEKNEFRNEKGALGLEGGGRLHASLTREGRGKRV